VARSLGNTFFGSIPADLKKLRFMLETANEVWPPRCRKWSDPPYSFFKRILNVHHLFQRKISAAVHGKLREGKLQCCVYPCWRNRDVSQIVTPTRWQAKWRLHLTLAI
jgi:hypothetical protein